MKTRHWVRLWVRVMVVLAVAACENDPELTAPTGLTPNKVGAVAQSEMLSELARSLALALNDAQLRAELGKAMKEEGVTYEQKLDVSSFMRSTRANSLRDAVSTKSKRANTSLLAMIDSLPPLEMYMPVREHRNKWLGGEVYVAAQIREGDPIMAYDNHGDAVGMSEKVVPAVPTVVLVGSETDFSPAARSSAKGRLRRSDPACQAASILCTGGAATPTGVVAGLPASLATIPSNAPYGLYMNYSNIADLKEPFTRGDPEIEVFVMGPRNGDTNDQLRFLSCAGAQQTGAYYFDQNDQYWDGYVLLMSDDSLSYHGYFTDSTRALMLTVWEDDNQACVVHDKLSGYNDELLGDFLSSSVADGILLKAGHGSSETGAFWVWKGILAIPGAYALYQWATDGDDDLVGAVTTRAKSGVIVPYANSTLILDTVRDYSGAITNTNGGINITHHGANAPSGVPAGAWMTFNGPWSLNFEQEGTWSAYVTGGTPPYAYEWSGAVSGTDSVVSDVLYEDDWVMVDVTDAAGGSWHWEVFVDVDTCNGLPCTRKTALRPWVPSPFAAFEGSPAPVSGLDLNLQALTRIKSPSKKCPVSSCFQRAVRSMKLSPGYTCCA